MPKLLQQSIYSVKKWIMFRTAKNLTDACLRYSTAAATGKTVEYDERRVNARIPENKDSIAFPTIPSTCV